MTISENARIAAKLREAAEALDSPFRAAAFRRAADTVEQWPRPIREVFERRALQQLPGVGPGIAAAIAEMLTTGRWKRLELLRGRERAFVEIDDDGVEHEYVVVEASRPEKTWSVPDFREK